MERGWAGIFAGTLLILVAGASRQLEAQSPTAVNCTSRSWYEPSPGKSGPFTYYVSGQHQFPQSATFTVQGWSDSLLASALTHVTPYPYPDKISNDGRALLRQVTINVVCYHYDVSGSSGYDTAASTTLSGVPEAYLLVAENDGPTGGSSEGSCWYLVLADGDGIPIRGPGGEYYIVDTMGDCG